MSRIKIKKIHRKGSHEVLVLSGVRGNTKIRPLEVKYGGTYDMMRSGGRVYSFIHRRRKR